jgi:hypothetical protein
MQEGIGDSVHASQLSLFNEMKKYSGGPSHDEAPGNGPTASKRRL